jgi:hypothetical protein
VAETRVDDDLFLVEPASGEAFYLDSTGAALWRLLIEPQTLADIEAVFSAAFPDAPRERLAEDLRAILAEMVARGLAESV